MVRNIDNFAQIKPPERPKLFHWYEFKPDNTLGKKLFEKMLFRCLKTLSNTFQD